MKQRYCPYCDQKMTSGRYCKGCKRIVWHPYVQDVDYYLNERHPQHEADCLYHDGESGHSGKNPSDQDAYAGVFRNMGEQTKAGNTGNRAEGMRNVFERARSTISQREPAQEQKHRDQTAKSLMDRVHSERGRKKPMTGVAIIFVIWMVLVIAGTLMSAVKYAARTAIYGIEDLFSPSGDSSWNQIGFINGDAESELAEGDLSDDEVRLIGEACSSYGHYEAQGMDVCGILEQKIKEYGATGWSEETYSYNYRSGDSSCYETNYEYAVDRNGTYLGNITVFTDTATDELHGIGASGIDEEAFYELADAIGAVMQELGYLGEEESGQAIYKTLITSEDMIIGQSNSGVSAFTTGYGPEISASQDQISGSVYDSMEIYAPGYYTDAE